METYDFDLENLISQMTNEEKAQLCSGRDFWHTQNIDRLVAAMYREMDL